jgi:O-antigen/teichoic acid export membrane protein
MNLIIQEAILSKGRSKELLYMEIAKKSLLVILILLTIKKGVIGLALGWTISSFLTLLLSLYLSKKINNYSFLDLAKDSFPYFMISLTLCVAAYFISLPITNNYLFLLFCTGFVGILYLFFCKLFKLEASEEMFNWIDSKLKHASKKTNDNI